MDTRASSNIDWRKVWNAMHSLQYNLITELDAIKLAIAAGHPKPHDLVARTLTDGYQLKRE